MVFSSLIFVFAFLPIVYLTYLAVGNIKLRNAVLTVASLVFYAWGEGTYVLLMLGSVLVNYVIGLLIDRHYGKKKFFVFAAVVTNIGMLFVFKYLGFFCSIFSSVTKIQINDPSVHLPIGISFFSFQILSYVIDVSRDRESVQKNFFNLLLYISLFPQLIAGPIVKYHDIMEQLECRKLNFEQVSSGIRRFIIGLSKKLIIADTVAKFVDEAFSLPPNELTFLAAWAGATFYMVQIYFDFSGYSDMAIGLGKMFGFEFKENFLYPYFSKSIKEFWNRWHISLSTWFKEYLYIPLGGNRKGKTRTYINLFIVFLATGLWHGANMTFVVWGIYNGLLVIFERVGIIPINKVKFRPVRHIYTVFAVLIGFTVFRAETLSRALTFIKTMFSFRSIGKGFAGMSIGINMYVIFVFAISVFACLPILPRIKRLMKKTNLKFLRVTDNLSFVVSIVMYVICFLIMASNSYCPFIYFRF